ncbi:transposase domain-containing protein [Novosphingobium sp.]|uniref:transposase domain-containing protein n=1 Tax=Novosphingobium sp. TaxID=1874826 RepID=UPI0035AE0C7C
MLTQKVRFRGIGLATLIETCKLSGINPLSWLADTLCLIASGHPATRVHELMLWIAEARGVAYGRTKQADQVSEPHLVAPGAVAVPHERTLRPACDGSVGGGRLTARFSLAKVSVRPARQDYPNLTLEPASVGADRPRNRAKAQLLHAASRRPPKNVRAHCSPGCRTPEPEMTSPPYCSFTRLEARGFIGPTE